MGEEKWMRRKPGRVSGTVVPPPAGDDLPALPQPREPGRSRYRPEGSSHGRTQSPPPELPDNVRPLFQTVLRPREAGNAGVGTALAPSPPRAVSQANQQTRQQVSQQGGPADDRLAGGSGRRHVAWLATLTVLLLLTAAGTTVALLGQRSGGGQPGAGASGTVLARAAATTADAARWVSREVSRSAIVGCDAVMCALLVKVGIPSPDLMLIRPSSQDPLGADVIVATPALQAQFGSRLSTEYAPGVLASFGVGRTRVDVRVVAAEGAAAYQLAMTRDIAARELQGTQLVGNTRIVLPASAKTELAAGQVDPRLLIMLPPLAQQHPVRVLAFYNRAPGASAGIPLTGVKLAGSDQKAGMSAHAYLRWLVGFLHSQRSLYRAASVTTAWHHGRAVVSIKFALPDPIGLLN